MHFMLNKKFFVVNCGIYARFLRLTFYLRLFKDCRMNVILEGPDGGGKSTLAGHLSKLWNLRLQEGSGPPKKEGEIEQRLAGYLKMENTIFDRHPAVSEPIYTRIRQKQVSLEFKALTNAFYQQNNLFIYCRSTTNTRHVVKPGEDPRHIEALNANYDTLVQLYDQWALRHAHHIYRIEEGLINFRAWPATGVQVRPNSVLSIGLDGGMRLNGKPHVDLCAALFTHREEACNCQTLADENASVRFDMKQKALDVTSVGLHADGSLSMQWHIKTLEGVHPKGPCDKAPAGWRCSRELGHEGPCAAHPAVSKADDESVGQGLPTQEEFNAAYDQVKK